MKRILLIIGLFIFILNNHAQDEVTTNYLDVSTETNLNGQTYIDGDSLQKFIRDNTSGTLIDGAGGLYKSGDDIKLGTNPLDENVEMPGAGYDLEFGTNSSKIGELQFNSNVAYINSDNTLEIVIGSTTYWITSEYIINTTTNDTAQYSSDVLAKILAAAPYLPYNFKYIYSTTTTDSRPGVNYFRLNSATYSSVTQIYLDYFDSESVDKSDFISLADTGGFIGISDGTNYINYKVTGGVVDGGSYYKIGVTYQNNSGVISGLCYLSFDFAGGSGGGGTPGGVYGDIQYNNSGIFDGAPITTDGTDVVVTNNLTASTITLDTLKLNSSTHNINSTYTLLSQDFQGIIGNEGSPINGLFMINDTTWTEGPYLYYKNQYQNNSSSLYLNPSQYSNTINLSNGITSKITISPTVGNISIGGYAANGDRSIINAVPGTGIQLYELDGGASVDIPLLYINEDEVIIKYNNDSLYRWQADTFNMAQANLKSKTIESEKTNTDTLTIGGVNATSFIDPQDGIEAIDFNKLYTDSIMVGGDTITSMYEYAEMYMTGNTTATTISVADTWYSITGGTFNSDESRGITHSAGVLTAAEDGVYRVSGVVGVSAQTTSSSCRIGPSVNDADVLIQHASPRKFSNNDLGSMGIAGTLTLSAGDNVRLKVLNIGGTGDFTIQFINVWVEKIK